ncbi:MAG: esterase family protein, partial [Acidobacteriaceae bacterium]|nr:esterase family protein [Acidobacteriaceae bacterium]
MFSMYRLLSFVLVLTFAVAQTPAPSGRPPRPIPPSRDPNTPGFVQAKELPDGTNPPLNEDGNFIVGPTHAPAPETMPTDGVPKGEIYMFKMESTESKFYPGIARDPNTYGQADPNDPSKMIVTTSHPKPYSRLVHVYVPRQ